MENKKHALRLASYSLPASKLIVKMVLRIAIFRALYLGDMLCIIPAVRAIRTAYPEAEIFLVGLPWQAGFAKRFPCYFDHFVEFPGWPGLPEQEPEGEKVIEFLQDISTYKFDLIFQMQGNGELTNCLCMLWGGKKVCGLRKPGEYAPDPACFPVSEDGEHEVLRFVKLIESVGIKSLGTHLEFPLTKDERANAMRMVSEAGLRYGEYVCIHPGARDKRRRWPVDHFATIADRLTANGYPLVLTGSTDEHDVLQQLESQIQTPVLNIVKTFGHVGIGELAALLAGSRLLVSNDTGVSHIAAALHLSSVIIFSQFSDIGRWRPLDNLRHDAIPWEKASDPEYVWRAIASTLELENPVAQRGYNARLPLA